MTLQRLTKRRPTRLSSPNAPRMASRAATTPAYTRVALRSHAVCPAARHRGEQDHGQHGDPEVLSVRPHVVPQLDLQRV